MNRIFIFIVVAIPLFADFGYVNEVSEPTKQTALADQKEKDFFMYAQAGGCGFLYLLAYVEGAVGYRTLNRHHVLDVNLGGSPQKYFYGQASYLYFPKASSGTYFGIGLTGGRTRLKTDRLFVSGPSYSYKSFLNIPFTIGAQSTFSKYHQFIQFQITPRLTGSLNYGIGF
ncbi:MAG: hypothetical protein IT584_02170 [Chlamydiae bacterium]|nr:hypothetical protein [Chlamydiota bacterium]